MLLSFFGRNVFFNLVAVQYGPDLVAIIDHRKSKDRCYFRGYILLGGIYRSEKRAGAYINQQHHRQLALFLEYLREGVPEPCRYVPVNEPDIIPRIVFPHLAKRHAFPLERTMVLSRKQVARQLFALDLQLADFFEYLGCCEHIVGRWSLAVGRLF